MSTIKSLSNSTWLFLALALVLNTTALGQSSSFHEQGRHMEDRERVRQNIETLRMWKLLDALDLTSEQSTQFLPVLKDFQDAKRQFADERDRLFREIEAILDSEEIDQKALQENLADLDQTRSTFQRETEQFLAKSREILSLKQQARLLLFEERFERRLKESIQEMRRKGRRSG
jgi:Spy/CpxP family protein refolding chaperone